MKKGAQDYTRKSLYAATKALNQTFLNIFVNNYFGGLSAAFSKVSRKIILKVCMFR
jgi:hypothetical protein